MIANFKSCMQTGLPADPKYFKEEAICEVLTIPCQKPDMERPLEVIVWAEIENIRTVETEQGVSVEGQKLSGTKLVVEVRLKEKLTYVANEATQTVHAAHYETLKSMFVIVPSELNGKPICNLLKSQRLRVIPYVEDVTWRMLDCRNIHKCVMLFLDVKAC
ncbi:hypothetical protein [Clostridium sp.]|uniref:hypothetical protein n=1 Tax=Clostridium sp. TaxID=1506 RepID=UPI003F2BB3FE